MILKRYQNEFIISIALMVMITSYIYKDSKAKEVDIVKTEVASSAIEASEIISLKKQWGGTELSKSILKLKKRISPDKIKRFEIKRKKLTATFQNLSSKEMNTIVSRLENIAVQIIKLEVKIVDGEYEMEIKCKW